jgi:ribosomal protein L44E
MIDGPKRRLVRPKTAATTTKKDEDRIKKKLAILENIERKIEDDLEEFNNKRKPKSSYVKGIKVTKKLFLESS